MLGIAAHRGLVAASALPLPVPPPTFSEPHPTARSPHTPTRCKASTMAVLPPMLCPTRMHLRMPRWARRCCTSTLIASYVISGLWGLLPWLRASIVSTCPAGGHCVTWGRALLTAPTPAGLPVKWGLCGRPPWPHLATDAPHQRFGHRLEVAVAAEEAVEQHQGWARASDTHLDVGQRHSAGGRERWGWEQCGPREQQAGLGAGLRKGAGLREGGGATREASEEPGP